MIPMVTLEGHAVGHAMPSASKIGQARCCSEPLQYLDRLTVFISAGRRCVFKTLRGCEPGYFSVAHNACVGTSNLLTLERRDDAPAL